MPDPRARLLRAAVGFCLVPADEPELKLLHRWLDCWRGIGDVVVGMKRQGYGVSLGDHGSGQWIAVFYAGRGGWDSACRDVLGLTKMDWNNDSLYDRLPVTMSYAQVLAQTVKRMSDLAPTPTSSGSSM